MTAKRPGGGARSLPPGEWERLVRERVYLRPIPVAPALHVMARRRIVTACTDSQDEDTTNPKESRA